MSYSNEYDENDICKRCGKYMPLRWCKLCQINDLEKILTNWTSGNEKIDNLIQEMQLGINSYDGIIVEWISYDQFNDIKELGKDELTTTYSAIWKDGLLQYNYDINEYSREQNYKVNLKSYNSQYITNEFLNKVDVIYKNGNNSFEPIKIYGISQNPHTKYYIIVLSDGYHCYKCGKEFINKYNKWCISCQINDLEENFTNWTSGSEKIDKLIQEKQLRIDNDNDIIVEWIPYDQFNDIKELYKDEYFTIYSAVWKDGLLQYNESKYEYSKSQNTKVNLKCLHNFQNNTNEFLNKVKEYFNDNDLYGITQNSETKDYILVLQNVYCNKCGKYFTDVYNKWCKSCQINELEKNFINWSGNEKIDNLIQKMQLEINKCNDVVEWIPYDQFNDIEELSKNEFTTIYSAIWKDGPLYYDENKYEYLRNQDKQVNLKLYNSKNNTNEFLNEVKEYFNESNLHGISQNPHTKNYFIVFLNEDYYCNKCGKKFIDKYYKWCRLCQINDLETNFTNWTSGNEKIDNLIQEMQLKINKYDDIIAEWILYDQFNDIKEIKKDEYSTKYSAIWKDGLLQYNESKYEYSKSQDTKVNLKCLHNLQDNTDEFLNKVKEYSNDNDLYGISQNSETKDCILVLQNIYCAKCGKHFTNKYTEWCKSCTINDLNMNLTSGNEKIDNLIQEMQSKISSEFDNIVGWIPYNHFNDIKELGKYEFTMIYSAIWKDGLLKCNRYGSEYLRNQDAKVNLKCLHNSQNITNEFLNEVKGYFSSNGLYGISQNPYTNNYFIVSPVGYHCDKCGKHFTDYVKSMI